MLLGSIDYKKKSEEYKEERDQLAEEMNQISELLIGYRGGRFSEIIQAIAKYKTKSYKHEKNQKVEKLFDLIDDLAAIKEIIIEDT
jgi:uncharacterized protein (DUF1015 family)